MKIFKRWQVDLIHVVGAIQEKRNIRIQTAVTADPTLMPYLQSSLKRIKGNGIFYIIENTTQNKKYIS